MHHRDLHLTLLWAKAMRTFFFSRAPPIPTENYSPTSTSTVYTSTARPPPLLATRGKLPQPASTCPYLLQLNESTRARPKLPSTTALRASPAVPHTAQRHPTVPTNTGGRTAHQHFSSPRPTVVLGMRRKGRRTTTSLA